ncbi:MAG: hypothetical protein AMJ43_07890 [Coxiella sp. DG_40]|nr:MAG: hypothetical protein AMJ43_07890 [Coxiella sp. DG_40]
MEINKDIKISDLIDIVEKTKYIYKCVSCEKIEKTVTCDCGNVNVWSFLTCDPVITSLNSNKNILYILKSILSTNSKSRFFDNLEDAKKLSNEYRTMFKNVWIKNAILEPYSHEKFCSKCGQNLQDIKNPKYE